MGDCGYLDDAQRFWFCGRASQRVVTENSVLYTIPTEARFNVLSGIARSALVGIGPRGRQQPAIVLELKDNPGGRTELEAGEITGKLIATMRQTSVRHLLVYPRSLPVDVRHNAKIAREQLAEWAQRQLSRRRPARCVLFKDVS
jgi:acyl-coenzyme A synthetase/AMP-(fatty) acid ligase